TLSLHDALPIYGAPAVELADGLVDDPVRDRGQEAGALGGGQEEARRDELAGAVPAHERLDVLHRAGGEVDDRLVLEHELATGDGVVQRGGQLEVAGR